MKQILAALLIISTISFAYSQKTIDVDDFTEISLRTAATIYVTQGSTYSVEVSGDEEALEETEIYVKGQSLIIDDDNDWSFFGGNDSDDVVVNVTMPTINGLSVSGSGRLYSKNSIKTDDLELRVSGSGRMELDTEAQTTDVSISGSGKIDIKGTTQKIGVSISGSGKIRGEDLKAQACRASISGSGSCEIYVENSLDVKISGSGSVYYKGSPQHVDSHTSGSGRVKKM